MSLMASPSSALSSRNWSYNVFASFHGPDARKTLLSHMREQFCRNGITMFNDQKIERSATIAPSLTEGIRESRISIVILSKKYASSSWCLDELVEILKCKELVEQIVMTIFYGVDPSDVRNQTGEFGIAFNETCARKSDEERQKWSKALNEVGNIAGEDFFRWDDEAKMIEKIARDVSDKLNATPSRDFDGMVGLEAHLREMESLLDLDNDGVKMVGITGPAGIGKTTIARALQSLFSNRFQLTCFMDKLRGSYLNGLDELRLQEKFLSKVLNQDGIRICHSGVIEERLCKLRVLIILDDVNNIKQLMALVNETTWFGPGSRILVTTENKELLKQHGIHNIYYVGFPSDKEAVKILCRYAFRKDSLHHGFEKHVQRVTELCAKLPLALSVVGSSLRGKNEDEWEDVMKRLETILDGDIEDVLRVGYESLDENEQTLYLHIAVFFNYREGDLVKNMFADSDLDVNHGLKILENRSLIEIDRCGERLVMHRLLQQVGKKAIHKQETSKRQILMDVDDICDALEDAKGTRKVVGISFDISDIYEVSISKEAFKRMPNLRFLKVYESKDGGKYKMHIPGEIEFPRLLRFLDWEAYPSKSLPPSFHAENLVELQMQESQLEYLWKGTLPLKNLKIMDLSDSFHLKEVPDLSNATNLKFLFLINCKSLVEIPSSCSYLQKLTALYVNGCINLQVIPAHMNLASLDRVTMGGCSRLRNIPVMSTNIKYLSITNTAVEDVSPSGRLWSHLQILDIRGSRKFKGITHLPTSLNALYLISTDIERIPDCIKDLRGLLYLALSGCRRLASLPELPDSLRDLVADDCGSLKTVFCLLNTKIKYLDSTNCFKLGKHARTAIIQQSFSPGKTILPGRKVPGDFNHRTEGNTLIIRPDGNPYTGFVFCIVISPRQKLTEKYVLSWRRIIAQDDGYPVKHQGIVSKSKFRTEHLFIFHPNILEFYAPEDSREIVYEFSSRYHNFDIIGCGAKVLNEESYEFRSDQLIDDDDIEEEASEDNTEHIDPTNGVICDYEKHRNCWNWLFPLLGLLTAILTYSSIFYSKIEKY